MVGSDACGNPQKAIGRDSAPHGGSGQTNFGTSDGSAIAQLVRLNKAVPAIPMNLGVAGTYLTVYNRAKH